MMQTYKNTDKKEMRSWVRLHVAVDSVTKSTRIRQMCSAVQKTTGPGSD